MAARVDDVPLTETEPLGQCAGLAGACPERLGPDAVRHPRRKRHDPDAVAPDVEEPARPSGVATTVIWSPILCERPDGSRYGIHLYYQRHGIGGWERVELQGGIEHPDGRFGR